MKRLVIYHNDLDGICSAAIIRYHYSEDIKCLPVQYGCDETERVVKCISLQEDKSYDELIIVDFSFDPHTMELLSKRFGKSLIWIDHHKTACEKNPKLWKSRAISGKRSMRFGSACLLTWEYFFPDTPPPEIVGIISDWDTWTFKFGNITKEFFEYANLKLTSPEDKQWREFFENSVYRYLSLGKMLLEAKQQRIERIYDTGYEGKIDGKKAYFVNSFHDISSLGEYIYDAKKHDIAVIWHQKNDRISVSLRSKKIDVGKIAEKFGGGGHKFASGFFIKDNNMNLF